MKQSSAFDVRLQAAALQSLHTTPVTVAAAPGGGKVLIPTQIVVEYVPGTAAFTSPQEMFLKINGVDAAPVAIAMGADLVRTVQFLDSQGSMSGMTAALDTLINQPMEVSGLFAGWLDGDGSIIMHVKYWVLDVV